MPTRSRPRAPRQAAAPVAAGALALALLAGCAGRPADESETARPTTSGTAADTSADGVPSTTPPPEPPEPPEPGTVPPDWLGTRVLTPRADGAAAPQPTPPELDPRRFTLPDQIESLPGTGFASEIADPAPAEVIARSTWRDGCPVAASDLAWIRVTFWGFDDARHTGELLVAADVAADLVEVFAALFEARFPLEEMRVTSSAELDAEPTGDGNNTESFVCRPITGGSGFSQHAYGTAVDINPFQNPYDKGTGTGRVVIPELATSYTDRSNLRPGMVLADDVVVQAFAAIGWRWGGAWSSLRDYQHFSLNGR